MKKLFLFLALSFPLWAQTTCTINSPVLHNAGNVSLQFDNRLKGCVNWVVTYWAVGYSALSVQLEGAPDNGGQPGSWSALTAVTGFSNPSTNTTFAPIVIQNNPPWLRFKIVSNTGNGSVTFQVSGAAGVSQVKVPAASPGGSCGALGGDLSGTCAAAVVVAINGQAVTGVETTSSTKLASFTGSDPTNGNCPDFNGKSIQDSGFPCGTANAPSGTLASFTFGSPICDGCCSQAGTTIAIAAAAVGDGVTVGASPALSAGIQAVGKVTGAGVVTVEVCNWTGSAVTPTSITYKANVIHGT